MLWSLRSAAYDNTEESVASTFTVDYRDVLLGRIAVPEDAEAIDQIRLTLRARRDSGTGNLRWDFVTFVPHATRWHSADSGLSETLTSVVTDPTSNTPIFVADDALVATPALRRPLDSEGPIPAYLAPGLSIMTVTFRGGIGGEANTDFRYVYSPRYFA